MNKVEIIGQIELRVRHLPSAPICKASITFEGREDSIYYCWEIIDKAGTPLAGKCLLISRRTIDINELDFAINHAVTGINNYRINRQRVFQVENI